MSTATIEETRTVPATGARSATRSAGAPVPGTATATPTRPATTARPAPRAPAGRSEAEGGGGTAPFVLLIMVLLTSGLVATLWLSTAAAADSYRLEEARQVARDLSEQSERLHRGVEGARSAPALAAAARAQGMVPGDEPAVLLVAPDGSTRVIGDPRPARAAPRPAPPRPLPPAAPGPPAPGAPAGDDERLRAVPGADRDVAPGTTTVGAG